MNLTLCERLLALALLILVFTGWSHFHPFHQYLHWHWMLCTVIHAVTVITLQTRALIGCCVQKGNTGGERERDKRQAQKILTEVLWLCQDNDIGKNEFEQQAHSRPVNSWLWRLSFELSLLYFEYLLVRMSSASLHGGIELDLISVVFLMGFYMDQCCNSNLVHLLSLYLIFLLCNLGCFRDFGFLTQNEILLLQH